MAASSHDVFFSTSISIFLFNLFSERNRVKVYIAKYDETEKQGINMAHRYVCIYIYMMGLINIFMDHFNIIAKIINYKTD